MSDYYKSKYTGAEIEALLDNVNGLVNRMGIAEGIITQEATDRADGDANLQTQINGKQDALTIDAALSSTSTNPVQNKAVKNGIDGAVLNALNARYSALADAVYDSTTGKWKMHKEDSAYLINNLEEEDMEKICASPDFNSAMYYTGALYKGKTNRPLNTYRIIRGDTMPVSFFELAHGNRQLEVLYIAKNGVKMFCVNDIRLAFADCSNLKVVKHLDVSRCISFQQTFHGCKELTTLYLRGVNVATAQGNYPLDLSPCTKLTDCYIAGLSVDLNLGVNTMLSQDSLIYIVENATSTGAKILTFTGGLVSGWVATENYPTFSDFATYADNKGFRFETT